MPFPDNNLGWLILAAATIFAVALKRKIKEVPNLVRTSVRCHTHLMPAHLGSQFLQLDALPEGEGWRNSNVLIGTQKPSRPVSQLSCFLRENTRDRSILFLAVV